MSEPIKFPRNKAYKDFGNLLIDIAKEMPHVKSGIIILFDEDDGIEVLPVCTLSQCAFAAADLLRKAAE